MPMEVPPQSLVFHITCHRSALITISLCDGHGLNFPWSQVRSGIDWLLIDGGQRHYLPIKVNQAGVMPIIFASALFIVPTVLGSLPGFQWMGDAFNRAGFVYLAFYTTLIIFFSFMWTRLMFQPDDIANNLKEHGSFIPGIRPGKATSEYLNFVLNRVTLAGSVFLAVIAVVPNFLVGNLHVDPMIAYFLGGTSILIVVGVALDMVDRINAQLVMRNYEGLTSKSGGKGWTRR